MAIFVRAFVVTTLLALALSAPVARREGKVTKGLPMVISQYSNVGFANRHSKNADAVLADAPAARNVNIDKAKPAIPAEPAVPAEPKAEDPAPQPAVAAQPPAVESHTSEKLQESPVPAADPKPEAIPEPPMADLHQPEAAPAKAELAEVPAEPKAEVADVPAEPKPEAVPAPAADLSVAEVAPVPVAAPAEPVPASQDDLTNQEQHVHEPVAETHADAPTENKQAEIQELPSAPVAQLPAEPSLNENLAEPVAPISAVEETHAEPEHAAAAISEVVSDVLPQTSSVETTEIVSNAEVSTEKEEAVHEVHEISTEQPAAIVEEAPSVPVVEETHTGVDEVVAQESESVAFATSVPVEETEAVKNTEATPQEVHIPENIPVLTSNSQERSAEEIQEVAESHEADHKTESDAESQEMNNLREARQESHTAQEEADHDRAKDDKLVSKAEKLEKLEKAKLSKDKPYKSPKHDDYEDRRKRAVYF